KAKKACKIKHIDNKFVNEIARYAGSPEDKTAGLYIHKKKGEHVNKYETLFTIHSPSQEKLKQAAKFFYLNEKKIIEFAG
ncbi:MAG: thymidine phosphorylase, partial [Nanoarchaeota archaeon]